MVRNRTLDIATGFLYFLSRPRYRRGYAMTAQQSLITVVVRLPFWVSIHVYYHWRTRQEWQFRLQLCVEKVFSVLLWARTKTEGSLQVEIEQACRNRQPFCSVSHLCRRRIWAAKNTPITLGKVAIMEGVCFQRPLRVTYDFQAALRRKGVDKTWLIDARARNSLRGLASSWVPRRMQLSHSIAEFVH